MSTTVQRCKTVFKILYTTLIHQMLLPSWIHPELEFVSGNILFFSGDKVIIH